MGTIVSNPKKPPPFRCFLNIIINYIMVPLSSRSALQFFSKSYVLHSTLKTSLYTSNYFYMHYIPLPPSTSHHVCTYSLIFLRCCAKPDKSTNKHYTHTHTYTHCWFFGSELQWRCGCTRLVEFLSPSSLINRWKQVQIINQQGGSWVSHIPSRKRKDMIRQVRRSSVPDRYHRMS